MVANVGSRLRFLIFGSPATSVLALLCMKKVLINADMLATKENNDLFFTMLDTMCFFRTDRFAIAEIKDDLDCYDRTLR